MAKYGAIKYAEDKYGNDNYIDSTTAGYKTAQAGINRRLYSLLMINSHYQQYGQTVDLTNQYIGTNAHRRLAQRFIAPKSLSVAGVMALLKGASGNTGQIIAEIQTESSGKPSGTAVANASITISAVTCGTFKWVSFTFPDVASLTAGTPYWIVFREDGSTTNSYYLAFGERGANDQPGYYTFETGIYGSFKYGTGIKYGTDWTSNWTEITGYSLLSRLVSSATADNDQVIKEAVGWRLTRNRDIPAYDFNASIVNVDYKYSVGQAYEDYLSTSKRIKGYLGYDISGTGIVYYRVFTGLSNESPASGDVLELGASCYMKRLLSDRLSSSALGGIAYEDALSAIAIHAGIPVGDQDLRVTGKTTKAGIYFKDQSASDMAEKIREATVDRLQFYNTQTLKSTARAKASVSDATAPTYILQPSDYLIDLQMGRETDKMINRVTVTNDEAGETTTDGATLTVSDYQTVGTASGTIASGSKTATVVITLTEYASIYNQVSNAETASEISSVTIDPGDYNSYGSVTVVVKNKLYPDNSADYDLTVSGCPITNAGAGTMLAEAMDYNSVQTYGLNGDRFDNIVFASQADADAMADAVISEKSVPIEKIKATARGIADIFPDDVVRFVEARKTKLNHLAIVTLAELTYTNDPAQFTLYIEAERTDYVGS